MNSPILLIGKNGQLGGELAQLLPALGDLTALDRRQLDLSKPADIRRAIRETMPSLIVNAAAYTAVDQAEKDEPAAHAINAEAPGVMAEEAVKIGAGLVHYSTDYVFDGSKNSPYLETDLTNPVSVYGRSKLAGERAIRDSGAAHLIFRTAWVYGVRGRNFLLTILRLAAKREELRIVRDQIGAPTWSHEIALATTKVLERLHSPNARFDLSHSTGTYHLTAAGETNWAEFATAILDCARAMPLPHPQWFTSATENLPLIAQRVVAITTAEYPTPARRPAYSVLSNQKLQQTFGLRLPDWRTQLRSVFS